MIKGVIFDCDGLLIDSEAIYTEITQLILDEYHHGSKLYEWALKKTLMGKPMIESAERIVEYYDLPINAHQFLDRFNSLQVITSNFQMQFLSQFRNFILKDANYCLELKSWLLI